MSQIETAISIALDAHKGQVDKAGAVYILHPLRIMGKMSNDAERIVALLHDVLEDSSYTAKDLLAEGISGDLVDAVIALTKVFDSKGVPIAYEKYLIQVKSNPLACRVKLADLEDNMDLSRLNQVTEKDIQRVEKYQKAKAFLLS
jgi:(p)ppGpp synthase/HD superfamily hydrolase